MIYLDNAATTRASVDAIKATNLALQDFFANPSSPHKPGVLAKQCLEDSRRCLAKTLGVKAARVVFTSSGTESDNLALLGILTKPNKGGNLILSPLEHPAIARSAEWLEQKGIELRWTRYAPTTGELDLDHLCSLIDDKTLLVSICHVHSETGLIMDLAKISQRVKAKRADLLIHSDGVQAFGKIGCDISDLGVDLYSISSHKIHGIKGAGALVLPDPKHKGAKPLKPMILGGGQEMGLRSGTENLPAIAAFAVAVQKAAETWERNLAEVALFEQGLMQVLASRLPKLSFYCPLSKSPYILMASLAPVPGEVLLHHLEQRGIIVGTGTACSSRSKKPSSALLALGIKERWIASSIRLSFAASALPKVLDNLTDPFVQALSDAYITAT